MTKPSSQTTEMTKEETSELEEHEVYLNDYLLVKLSHIEMPIAVSPNQLNMFES